MVLAQRRLDDGPRRLERLWQLLALLAAGAGQRVAAAASPADLRGGHTDDLIGPQAAVDQRRRDACDQIDATVARAPQHDRRIAEPALEPVGELEQGLAVGD